MTTNKKEENNRVPYGLQKASDNFNLGHITRFEIVSGNIPIIQQTLY